MPDVDTQVRRRPNRGARQPAKVRELVEDLAWRGHTPSAIHQQVTADLGKQVTPSLKTIGGMVKGVRERDVSGAWSVASDTTGVPGVVLDVLAAVIVTTAGKSRSITRDEAATIANIEQAAPGLPAFELWRMARIYLARAAHDEPTDDLDGLLAFQPWRGDQDGWDAYDLAVHCGRVRTAPAFLVRSLRSGPLTWDHMLGVFFMPETVFDRVASILAEREAEEAVGLYCRQWLDRRDLSRRHPLPRNRGIIE